MKKPTSFDLKSDKLSQGLRLFLYMTSLDRYGGRFNTLDNLSSRPYVLNKTKEVNLNVFNVNESESEALIWDISWNSSYKFDDRKHKLCLYMKSLINDSLIMISYGEIIDTSDACHSVLLYKKTNKINNYSHTISLEILCLLLLMIIVINCYYIKYQLKYLLSVKIFILHKVFWSHSQHWWFQT